MDKSSYYQNVHADSALDDVPPDWSIILKLAYVEQQFAPEGRYGAIAKVLKSNRPVGALLEIGCGLGETAAWMTRYAQIVEGRDIWLQSALKLPQKLALSFAEMDADEPWQLSDRSFDVVVAMMVLEHVFDPFHFVGECARVLKKDGKLFLNVPLISFYRHRFDVLLGRVPTTSAPGWFERGTWDGAHIHYFNLPMLSRLLAGAGLVINKKFAVGRMRHFKQLWPSMLCGEISVLVTHADAGKL